jgi:hypothetical protein
MILEPQVSPTLSPLPFHFRRYESLNHSCGSELLLLKLWLGQWKRGYAYVLAPFLQFDYTTLNLYIQGFIGEGVLWYYSKASF